jgi:hypothetical protein
MQWQLKNVLLVVHQKVQLDVLLEVLLKNLLRQLPLLVGVLRQQKQRLQVVLNVLVQRPLLLVAQAEKAQELLSELSKKGFLNSQKLELESN